MSRIPLFLLALLALCATGCAEKPDGVIVVNEETIENFIEGDRRGLESWNPPTSLNLVHNQPVMDADIPAVPPGQARLIGVLNSNGPYRFAGAAKAGFGVSRGSTFKNSVYGKLGPAGDGGDAWFYADVDPAAKRIVSARAYLYNFMGGVCDLRKESPAGFGSFAAAGFTIYIDGPCLFPQISGSTSEFALLIQGRGDPLTENAGTRLPIRYIVADTAQFKEIPANPQGWPNIYDSGTGWIQLAK